MPKIGDGAPKPDDYDELQGQFWQKKLGYEEPHFEFTDGKEMIRIKHEDYFKLIEKLVDQHDIPHKKHTK